MADRQYALDFGALLIVILLDKFTELVVIAPDVKVPLTTVEGLTIVVISDIALPISIKNVAGETGNKYLQEKLLHDVFVPPIIKPPVK